MRMNAQATRSHPKTPMSAASKVSKIVSDLFLPMCEGFVPGYTPLTSSPDAEEMLLLERIWDMFPEAMATKEDFVDRMGQLYDSGRQGGDGAPKRKRARPARDGADDDDDDDDEA